MGAGSSNYPDDVIWNKRDEYLGMTLLEKRNQYPGNFIAFGKIKPWYDYFMEDINLNDSSRICRRPLYPPNEQVNEKVSLWEGDITQLEVDAIVNSACSPDGRGQVNHAILCQAGEFYKEECLLNGLGRPGTAMLTGGYRLPAKYILNTVAPRDRDETILRSCYVTCLDQAKAIGLQSVAFPCIATKKRRGFPPDVAARIALDTVRNYMDKYHDKFTRVVFCLFDSETLPHYHQYMMEYFPIRGYCTAYPDAQPDTGTATYRNTSFSEPRDSLLVHKERAERTARLQSDAQSDGDAGGKELDLEDWRDDVTVVGIHEINVRRGNREHFVKRLLSVYKDTDSLRKEPVISFEGEEGVDFGALTKEYFFEAIDTLIHTTLGGSPAFEGAVDHMLPCASRIQLNAQTYWLLGKIVGHSLLHYGIGLCGLSRAVVFLLCHRVSMQDLETSGILLSVDDVTDMDLLILLQIPSASKLSGEDKTKLIDYMERFNIGYMEITDDNFELIKQEVLLYEVVRRRWGQIESLRMGMDEFGLYTFLCEYPTNENIRQVFPTSKDLEIQSHMVMGKLTLYGPEGDAWDYFKNFLGDLERNTHDGVTLNTLMLFWTGEPVLPSSPLAAEVDTAIDLPQASTCFHRLFIPGACADYEEFSRNFHMALKHGARGFGES